MNSTLGENTATVSRSTSAFTPLRGDTQVRLHYTKQTHTPSRAVMSLGSSLLYLCVCYSASHQTNVICTGAHRVSCVLNTIHSLNSAEYHKEACGDKLFLQPCVVFFYSVATTACLCVYGWIFTPYGKYWDFHFVSLRILFVRLCKFPCFVFTCGFYGDQPLRKHWRQFTVERCTLPSVCVLVKYLLSKPVP